jgi:hypothetical protein
MNEQTSKQRRLRVGDIVRIGGSPNTLHHLEALKIPVELHNCYGMIKQVGDAGVSFDSSKMPDREFHVSIDRVPETLKIHEVNKTFLPKS